MDNHGVQLICGQPQSWLICGGMRGGVIAMRGRLSQGLHHHEEGHCYEG